MGFLLLRASEEGPVMHYMHSNSFQCFEWCNITHYLHMLQIIKQSSTTSYMLYEKPNADLLDSIGNISRNMDIHKRQSYFVSQQKFILRVIVICHPQVYHYLPDESKFQLIHRKQHNEKESPHQIF